MKQTLKIGIFRRGINSNWAGPQLSEKIASTVYDRVSEAGMEKFSDMTKKFESKYAILDFVGEGTNALVKQCINRETQKLYAVKIIRTSDIELIKAIKSEFYIQKSLSHQNIVKAYEMFYNPVTSRIKIIMELAKGNELLEHIRKRGPLPGNGFTHINRRRGKANIFGNSKRNRIYA